MVERIGGWWETFYGLGQAVRIGNTIDERDGVLLPVAVDGMVVRNRGSELRVWFSDGGLV